jgi:hypothetical protein
MFNDRETRDALTAYESNFLNTTFTYVGAGLSITAASAYALHRTGASYRIMRANPWLVIGVSLVASVGSMMAVFSTPSEKTGQKLFWWTAFNIAQSATLSPLFFFSPALLARAGLYTAGVVGSLSYVGATARSDKYLYIGGEFDFHSHFYAIFKTHADYLITALCSRTSSRAPLRRLMRRSSLLSGTAHSASWNSRSSSHARRLTLWWFSSLRWLRTFRHAKGPGKSEIGRSWCRACGLCSGIVSNLFLRPSV